MKRDKQYHMKSTCSPEPNRITKTYQALEVKTWASKGYEQREPNWEKSDALRLSQRERNEGQREELRVNLCAEFVFVSIGFCLFLKISIGFYILKKKEKRKKKR